MRRRLLDQKGIPVRERKLFAQYKYGFVFGRICLTGGQSKPWKTAANYRAKKCVV